MALPRFHLDAPLTGDADIVLPDPLAHHALRVLRLTDGERIVLFDGRGHARQATLQVHGRAASARLGDTLTDTPELAGRITLVQGLASGDKMAWIIEKAVELGVDEIVPVAAQRSVLRLSDEREAKRLAQWRRTVVAACEQCGRNTLPEVHAPVTLAQWLAGMPADRLALLCHPEGTQTLTDVLGAGPDVSAIALLIGPEGGWSEAEVAQAQAKGVRAVRFGSRVLRTETAGIALTAAATALLGWQDGRR